MDFDGRTPTAPGKNGNGNNGKNGRHVAAQNDRCASPAPVAASPPAKTRRASVERRVPPEDATLAELLNALRAVRQGDFRVRLSVGSGRGAATGSLMPDIAHEFNAIIALNEAMANEMVRVERVVGREGRMTERASLDETSRRLGDRASAPSTRSSATWCSRPPRSRASSAPSPTAT